MEAAWRGWARRVGAETPRSTTRRSARSRCRWKPLAPIAYGTADVPHELVDPVSGRLRSTTSAIARQHELQLPLLLGLLDNQSCHHMSRWACSTCCWGDQGRADRWLRCPRPRWCESSATTRSRFSMSHIAELHFLLPRTNGEHAAPTPLAPFDGGISQLVLHVENGMFETFLSMCGTSAPARDYRMSTFNASGAALLLLLLACCCCCCCCWRTLTPPGVRCGANPWAK